MENDFSSRFSESNRGYWFTQRSDRFIYSYNSDNTVTEYYRIDEQEQTILKIDNKECVRLLDNTYALRIDREELEWLLDESKSKLKYFDNIEELEKYYEEM